MVTTRQHTIQELWNLGSASERFELIEGELIEVPPGRRRHGIVQARIGSRIFRFVEANQLGIVTINEGFILQRNPDSVLGPDVAFTSNASLAGEPERWSDVPPDLAVEVISPSNYPSQVSRKVRIYLQSGVRTVWVVYPERREVIVHEPGQTARTATGEVLLDGGEVLPGLTISLNDIFGE